jgi:N,N-dimethylformamidase beta subunit-like protein
MLTDTAGMYSVIRLPHAIVGFCWPLSAVPSEKIVFRVQSPAPCRVSIVRFENFKTNGLSADDIVARVNAGEELVPTAVPGWEDRACAYHGQPPNKTSPADPCTDWPETFLLTVPEWKSGVYAARFAVLGGKDPDGVCYVVFIVKPAANKRGDVLLLANVNTWNAYNDWGGYDRYTVPQNQSDDPSKPWELTFQRPHPLLVHPGIDTSRHLARGEIWVLNWLLSAGYDVDVYADIDWHRGIGQPNQYKAIILSTHPEYWTLRMLANLDTYLGDGGNLLCLGGNAIYEAASISDKDNSMTVYGTYDVKVYDVPGHSYWKIRPQCFNNLGRSQYFTLGVDFSGCCYDYSFPYIIPKDIDPEDINLFDGIQIPADRTIGKVGWNTIPPGDTSHVGHGFESGAACGWEIDAQRQYCPNFQPAWYQAWTYDSKDWRLPRINPAEPMHVLAQAIGNLTGFPGNILAEICYYKRSSGGIVFTVGSIRFGGALVACPELQQLVKNVLARIGVKKTPPAMT